METNQLIKKTEMDFENTPISIEARKTRLSLHPLLQIVVFFIIFITTRFIIIILTDTIFIENEHSHEKARLFSLFLLSIPIILIITYCKLIEKRSFYSMGFVKNRVLVSYLKGFLISFIMINLVILICLFTESVSLAKLNNNVNIYMLFLFFVGFIIQGAEEEILMRGYLMMSLSVRSSVNSAIFINSIIFALLHIFNNGVNIIPIINIILIGIFFSIYMLTTNNIWGICAMHSMWNFLQGNVWGLKVSGNSINTTIFKTIHYEKKTFINGGVFGPEGGIAVTLVIIISIMVLLVYKYNIKAR